MRRLVLVLSLALTACSTAASPSEPEAPARQDEEPAAPALGEIEFPAFPEGAPEAVQQCATEYRDIASAPFPARPDGQSLTEWWEGPFQGWVTHYNAVRERCDAVQSGLAGDGPGSQLMWGAQSYMHQRLGQRAIPYEEHAPMFMMGRYWTLGAACTYERCAAGPDAAWATLCRERGERMPPCPPPAPEGAAQP